MGRLSNITIKQFKLFLTYKGLQHIRTRGGHEVWGGENILRPVVFQTHEEPLPEMVIRSNLRTLNSNADELLEFLKKK